MSTKIYNGFRVDTTSLHDVVRVVEMFRPYVIESGERMMDRFFHGKDETYAWGEWVRCQQEIKTTGRRMPCCDTEFKVAIFPPHESAIFGIAFTEHEEWFDTWCSQPLVSEYGYWNNADAPEHVTDDEWMYRQKTWERVVGTNVPAMHGFTIDVSDPTGPMPKNMRTMCRTVPFLGKSPASIRA